MNCFPYRQWNSSETHLVELTPMLWHWWESCCPGWASLHQPEVPWHPPLHTPPHCCPTVKQPLSQRIQATLEGVRVSKPNVSGKRKKRWLVGRLASSCSLPSCCQGSEQRWFWYELLQLESASAALCPHLWLGTEAFAQLKASAMTTPSGKPSFHLLASAELGKLCHLESQLSSAVGTTAFHKSRSVAIWKWGGGKSWLKKNNERLRNNPLK